MRKLLVACTAAGSLLLGAGGIAASQGPADAATTDAMICEYTFANGICDLGQAQAGQPYEAFLGTAASDGGVFTVTGAVPPGTQVPYEYGAPGTILGGTPTTAGTYTFTVSGTDWNQIPIAPMTYQVTVMGNFQPPPVAITDPPVLPSGTFETNYTYVFNVTGGSIPYTWTVVSGQLPPGLYLLSDITRSQTGDDLSGTPRTTGTFTFTMQVTDGAGNKATKQFTLTIQPTPAPPVQHHGQQ